MFADLSRTKVDEIRVIREDWIEKRIGTRVGYLGTARTRNSVQRGTVHFQISLSKLIRPAI